MRVGRALERGVRAAHMIGRDTNTVLVPYVVVQDRTTQAAAATALIDGQYMACRIPAALMTSITIPESGTPGRR